MAAVILVDLSYDRVPLPASAVTSADEMSISHHVWEEKGMLVLYGRFLMVMGFVQNHRHFGTNLR